METQARDRRLASPQAGVERRRFGRVVVARRVDSERPTRVWSLLLPPGFDIGDQVATRQRPDPRTAVGRLVSPTPGTGDGQERTSN